MKKNISVVVPTLNEEANVQSLVSRMDAALKKADIFYKIIFIDDHSTDGTVREIEKLALCYPLKYWLKVGSPGKAFSLLEGFSRSSSEVIAMIDADLQYPPEAIPEMAEKILKGEADIVVARRIKRNEPFLRRLLSRGFAFFVGRVLCGLDVDVQAGLKVFRKEILEKISLRPSPWSFDLEFLFKARDAGYIISSVGITFEARKRGESKLKLVSSVVEIGTSAVLLRFKRKR
ncbi:glycosyltransferase family 2 protein [Candidatus Giovannonibacteria bacterium]|nr:glycosyltransferase family 2 protein [Candidatus Giovannonibacteria bacterium]